jgi:mannose-1-phosphate guanylyltransferase
MAHHAVIMAGGSGTRFWPASRRAFPKQFLPLGRDGESLLQASARRAAGIVGREQVRVVAAARHEALLREQLSFLPPEALMLEPTGRNTAPCIGWAAAHVRRADARALVAVLPADPYIGDEVAFGAVVRRALDIAERGAVVTIGIRPTRPETGYGYLALGSDAGDGSFAVRAFVEKPDQDRAHRFVAEGHLWNSGMFVFRVDVMLDEIERQLPPLHAFLQRWSEATDAEAAALIAREYATLPSVSIDHGVMEHARNVVVVPGAFGWDDVGSWSAAWALADKDVHGNVLSPGALSVDAENCYVQAGRDKRVVLLGTRDLVVVDTPDALLVVPRDRAQDVRRVVERLEREGSDKHL